MALGTTNNGLCNPTENRAATLDPYKWILENITPYAGDESFLAAPTEKTRKLWGKCKELLATEGERNGVLDMDDVKPSTLLSHELAKIDEELDDVIVGLQVGGLIFVRVHAYYKLRAIYQANVALLPFSQHKYTSVMLQGDCPLQRTMKPLGGYRLVKVSQ